MFRLKPVKLNKWQILWKSKVSVKCKFLLSLKFMVFINYNILGRYLRNDFIISLDCWFFGIEGIVYRSTSPALP